MQIKRSNFDLDLLRAAQYSYYCLAKNFITDQHYDQLDKEYMLVHGKEVPLGSEKKSDYTEAQRCLALYFLFSGFMLEDTTNPFSLL